MNIPKPPETKQQPVTDDYFGQKIVDPYRWLEDGSTPETQQWVAEQLAYTRSILDKLPGREKLHDRIEQLLEIGNLGETQVGGDYYFHTRRDGKQNQPVLYVRKGVDGKDEVLVDANQLSKDGTIALDWWQVVARRQVCRVRDVGERLGDEHAARHRDRDPQAAARRD